MHQIAHAAVDLRAPSGTRELAARIAPYALAAVVAPSLALLSLPLPHPEWFVLGTVLSLVVPVVVLAVPWRRLPGWIDVGPALAYVAAIAFLRHGAGPAQSGYAALVLLPILWLAAYRSPRTLAVGLVGVVAAFIAPILLVGAPDYPVTEWRRVAVVVLVAAFTGLTVQGLIRRVRAEVDARMIAERETGEHRDDLARLLAVAHELGQPSSEQRGRKAICEAAVALAHADLALLFELGGEGTLVTTGSAGAGRSRRVRLDPRLSMTALVFADPRPAFIGDLSVDARVDHRAVRRLGVAAGYWQPVLRDDRVLGVLVAYWRKPQAALSLRIRSMLELFALQAASAIERDDLIERLSETARTDPLTGVANRRALDDALGRELSSARRTGSVLAVALLDLDHFKRFNDDRGHQAGDRLLAECASAWANELRPADTIARYGGEEFVILLPGCDAELALRALDRLRRAVPGGQTCSGGLAVWQPGDSADTLLARADAALYRAKASGRNRIALDPAAPAPA